MDTSARLERLSTGIPGLDRILGGGIVAGRSYLVRGGPGTGKTTVGLQFLAEGAQAGERVLFITLEEPETHIRRTAEARGIDLTGIDFLDLSPTSSFFAEAETYDIFSPAEVERAPMTRRIIDCVSDIHPRRVFLDPMTQFRYLASDIFQYRRQVLSFQRFLVEAGATLVFTSEGSVEAPDADLQFLADGVIELTNEEHGRYVAITKLRGSDFHEGRHTVRIHPHGIEVFPRLIPDEHAIAFSLDRIPSGIEGIDELVGGGIERGTVTIISGPSGVGKTTLGIQFMAEAARRGERSAIYLFEEEAEVLVHRAESIGTPVRELTEAGMLRIIQVEPLLWSPDEFSALVRSHVESEDIRVAMIDSLAGYRLSIRGQDLEAHLHALARYLRTRGVAGFITAESRSVIGDFAITDAAISHLGDNIIILRYLELHGELRKAIGVLKKRLSDYEKTLREFDVTSTGIRVGEPLSQLRGILLGAPEWVEPGEPGCQ